MAAAQEDVPEPANAAELAELTGEVLIDGSSTVYPVTQAAAEEFAAFAPNVQVTVGISGTGGGFERFCNGETDISNASRPIDPDEAAVCAENGIEFIELPVAYDGLSVLVNPANDWAACLTVEELNTIWEPEAEGEITNWSQVRSDFPDAPLNLYGAGTDSGTFDYFTQAINGEEGASRGDFQASEDDNILVQGIAGDPNALGFFGYSYYVANQDSLKLVAVDDGDGECIEPSPETITDASYQPLSRPIFIYVKAESAERPEVDAFVDFYLSESFTPIIDTPEVGYVELPVETYAALAERFENRTMGSLFPNGAEIGATLERYTEGG
jgi:phosphate binding protein